MARTYSTRAVMLPLAQAKEKIQQLKDDQRLDGDYRRREIARLQTEANAAAKTAYRENLSRIRADQDIAQDVLKRELLASERGVNWQRAQYLHTVVCSWAGSINNMDQLAAAFQSAVDLGDVEAVRAWRDALPVIQRATNQLPDYLEKFPDLARNVTTAYSVFEPEQVKEARADLEAVQQAAQAYEQECKTISFTSFGLDTPGFMEERSAMFSEN